jgi:hypothetical protein
VHWELDDVPKAIAVHAAGTGEPAAPEAPAPTAP